MEQIDSFYQKCTYEKVTKNLGMALPPLSFGQNPKEQQLFFRETIPYCDVVKFANGVETKQPGY